MKCCMFAGINISGVNAEVMPAQWEYQASRGAGWDSAACRGQACRAHCRWCQPAPTCSSALLAPPCAAALCRWAPAPASPWATTCGCLATSCTAWRSCTTWRSPSTPRCSCWCLPAASTGGAAHMLQCAACQAPAPAVCSCLGCPPCSAPHMQPIPGDWNGAGGHTNFSSKSTRQAETGWQAIQDQVRGVELQINEWLLHVHPLCLPAVHATPATPFQHVRASLQLRAGKHAPDPPARPWCIFPNQQIAKLERRHAVHIAAYGEGNERRLTGASLHQWGCPGSCRMCESAQARQVGPSSRCNADGIRLLARSALQASTRRAASTTSAGAWPTAAAPSAWAAWCPWRSAVSGEAGHWVGGCC